MPAKHSDSDSSGSSDDQDYVPTAKELKQAEEPDTKKRREASSDDEQLTGVALLKEKKRQRDVDDLFALMNEQDGGDYTCKSKRQKTTAADTAPEDRVVVAPELKHKPASPSLGDLLEDTPLTAKEPNTTFNQALAAI